MDIDPQSLRSERAESSTTKTGRETSNSRSRSCHKRNDKCAECEHSSFVMQKQRPVKKKKVNKDSAGSGFFDNAELDCAVGVRAPGDHAPYDIACEELYDDKERCVACMYTQSVRPSDDADNTDAFDPESDIDTSEQRAAYREMMRLVDEHYRTGTSNYHLVDMIHQFYEREIRSQWDCGEWSKRSIWNHIMYHSGNERIQCAEMRNNLLLQIEALRGVAWTRKGEESNTAFPDHKNVRLMCELMKTHHALQESAYRRQQQQQSSYNDKMNK